MALQKHDNVVVMDGADQELAFPVRAKSLRWVAGADAEAGDQLVLSESSIGETSEIIFEAVAAGANFTEESSAGGSGFDFRNGLRVSVIDSGKLFIYLW